MQELLNNRLLAAGLTPVGGLFLPYAAGAG
jgi:hypothetical protein